MGKNLHYSILPYIEGALSNHNAVLSYEKQETEEYVFYNIVRVEKADLRVLVCDSYNFILYNYLSCPKDVDFILIAKPEAKYSDEILEYAKKDNLNLGKLGALMEILHIDNIIDYIPKERRKE